MGGGRSIQLGRIAGIRIGATPDWFLVLFLLIFLLGDRFDDVVDGGSPFLLAVVGALLFELSIVLHEIGHALAARRYGVQTEGIDLWFFGGVARLDREPDTPGREAVVAFAGPFVTALIVGVCALIATLAADWNAFVDSALLRDTQLTAIEALLGYLAVVNAFLFAFNMLPAYPLDGGRLARAAAWKVTGSRDRALRFAGVLGLGFSYLLMAFGVWQIVRGQAFDGVWLLVLGWSMAQSARSAVAYSALHERIDGVTVGEIMDGQPLAIPATATVADVHASYFAEGQYPWFAVADEDGTYRGILTAERVDAELAAGRPALTAGELLDTDAAAAMRVPPGTPLEALLGSEPLRLHGALMVVDEADRLRGVVTVEQVQRAFVAAAR